VAAVGVRPASPSGLAGVSLRLEPQMSAALLDETDERVLEAGLPLLAAVTGREEHTWVQVKRWRYALPAGVGDPALRVVAGSRIVLAGDTFTGVDLEAVHVSGLTAAGAALAIAGGV
jgi:predicted NAD/FAD-dependent oxidoreductase